MGRALGANKRRHLSRAVATNAFALPDLPYAYNALEPHVDTETMKVHHTKHHQAYITKINAAVEEAAELQGKSLLELQEMVGTKSVPNSVAGTVRNNGGGAWNHAFFWKIMKPKK